MARYKQIHGYLKPFQLGTDITQNDCESIALVIPTMIEIEEQLLNSISKYPEEKDLLNKLKDHLTKKFQFALNQESPLFDEMYLISSMIDPQKSIELTDELFTIGKALVINYFNKFKSPESREIQIIKNNGPPAKLRRTLTTKDITQDGIMKEVSEYLKMIESWNGESLKGIDFWIENSLRFPLMYKNCIEILSIPSTSSSPERLFSIAGYLSTGRRSNISPMLLRERVLMLYNKFIV